MPLQLNSSAKALRRGLGVALLAGAALLGATVGGCTSLPENVNRPVSQALPPVQDGPLAPFARDNGGDPSAASATTARPRSGFMLVDGPQAAYASRLALAEQAQRSLDLQYYAIHADASTGRLMRAVQDAAKRGVRVRILIDDFHSAGRNALVLGLADTPNVQIRLFNPLAGARASSIGRIVVSLGDVGRIQQRMHNKLFIADNTLGITGGRNLGDAYFGLGDAGNFVDLDVLAAGPIVQQMSKSFDQYWNDERAYPVESLVDRKEMDSIRDKAAESARSGAGSHPQGSPSPPDGEPRPDARSAAAFGDSKAAQRPGWDEKPMDLKTVKFVWAPSLLLVDRPGKIPADEQAKEGPSPAKPDAPHGEMPAGETVVEGLLPLIAEARQDLVIVSPYFVPGDQIRTALAKARERGVRVRVLTNSLASNDAPVAHVGYARHRTDLLDMGVELYEMRADQAGLRQALGTGSGVTGGMGESKAMLHSKFIVRDGRVLVIGSMNLDLRSQKQNTEIALLVRSPALSTQATSIVEKSLKEGAWKVERDPASRGALVWRAPAGSGLQDAHTEPDTSASLRALLWLIGPLAPDSML
ncbi:phosphatidylserine/phosphatidylglycerophosphate/cardiolipin synthase family protein [Pseudacidovorax sp. RU35E]|uniref:phospholipase D-like domain-containing protein n=1 Tax=Pseudacidovorax sp. RU35E TaxID=1907403 RepID=UPI0009548FD3|nr:Phosphatidylserine/phosphatidylglycerophosphate/cardiolipin synthase [Pseudacidovorax sp. RU35E]